MVLTTNSPSDLASINWAQLIENQSEQPALNIEEWSENELRRFIANDSAISTPPCGDPLW